MSGRGTAGHWQSWLRAGVAIGLSPRAFWALSVREWLALVVPDEAEDFGHQDLARLMAALDEGCAGKGCAVQGE